MAEKEDLVMQFQTYQQQLQSIMIQKETLKFQNLDIEKSLEELNLTKEKNAYKITGTVMISKPVEEIKKELNENKEALEIRIKSLEKTEEKITAKLKELQPKLRELK